MPRLLRWVAAALLALGLTTSLVAAAAPASAHDSTSEAVTLSVTDRRVLGTAWVLFTELGYEDTSGDGLLGADEMVAQEATIARGLVDAVRDHVRIEVDGDDTPVIGAGPAPASDETRAPAEFVAIAFATGPHDGDVSNMALSWSFTSPTQDVLLTGTDGTVSGRLDRDGTAAFSLDPAATISSFFVTGIDHVRLGLDHLLFLVVLTLAVVGSRVTRATTGRVVRLVTAFTVGHATSLALAYFDVVSVPAHWVEPAISLSIVAAAAVALRGKGSGIRPWLATAVGMVHGLGFASSLGSLALSTTHHVQALAAFNVGIDAAQTLVVLVVTGTIWLAGRVLHERQVLLRAAVCVGAGLVGLAWTASRLVP